MTVWNYDTGNYTLLRHTIQNSDWDLLNLDIDTQVSKVTDTIANAATKAIPCKEISIRPTDKP